MLATVARASGCEAEAARAASLYARSLPLPRPTPTRTPPRWHVSQPARGSPQGDLKLGVALEHTADVLLAIADAAADVGELAVAVVERAAPDLKPDAVAAAMLAEGSARAAAHLVAINLAVSEGDARARAGPRLRSTRRRPRSSALWPSRRRYDLNWRPKIEPELNAHGQGLRINRGRTQVSRRLVIGSVGFGTVATAAALLVVAGGTAGTGSYDFKVFGVPAQLTTGQQGLLFTRFEPTKGSGASTKTVITFILPKASLAAGTVPAADPATSSDCAAAALSTDGATFTISCSIGTLNPGQRVKRFVTFVAGAPSTNTGLGAFVGFDHGASSANGGRTQRSAGALSRVEHRRRNDRRRHLRLDRRPHRHLARDRTRSAADCALVRERKCDLPAPL